MWTCANAQKDLILACWFPASGVFLGAITIKMDTVPARSPGGILLHTGVHSFRTGMYRWKPGCIVGMYGGMYRWDVSLESC